MKETSRAKSIWHVESNQIATVLKSIHQFKIQAHRLDRSRSAQEINKHVSDGVQHADSSLAPGFHARSVARSGPSAGAQVAYKDAVRCAERDFHVAVTSVASSALRPKSVRPLTSVASVSG